MEILVKKFQELSLEELYEILKIRSEIFVVEQKCPYLDPDGKDMRSEHVMIKEMGEIIAYARVIKPGVSYDESSIGRILVVEKSRGKLFGKKLVQKAMDHITQIWGENRIKIGAQTYLTKFYSELGFRAVSESYLEDGIPHIDMIYEKR